jgi:molybdate transport system ATP-binding protein
VIELDVRLPLASFTLAVRCALREQVTAIAGRSGAGKTSLTETIAGLRPRAAGRIAIDGDDVSALPPERRRVGYVPQDAALFPHLSVRGNLFFGRLRAESRRLRGADSPAAIIDLLELAPLLDRAPASLSGGERQRVALGRALMTDPRLLLLDEPLASIDQPLRERILLFLRRVRDLGVPMIYVTHQPFEAMALAGWCVLLDGGRVIAEGKPREVLSGSTGELDNVFEVANPRHERERGITRVTTTEGIELVLPYDAVAGAVFPLVVRISADDIVVFGEKPSSVSSRNLLEAAITSITEQEGVVGFTAGGIRVRVTRAAADDLPLAAGKRVWLALRSRAFRVVG